MLTTTQIPTGTVTFLFTDIEGSTRLWEGQPRAMQAAVAHHDVLLREAIEQNGGYVFKTMGDAFCAAFPTAPQELRRFAGHTAGVVGVAFSPHGKYVLTGSEEDTPGLWYTDYRDPINYLRNKLVRDFTDDERAQYEIKDNDPTCPAH